MDRDFIDASRLLVSDAKHACLKIDSALGHAADVASLLAADGFPTTRPAELAAPRGHLVPRVGRARPRRVG
jgi:hypothetical protein